jgi:hypothetical protein
MQLNFNRGARHLAATLSLAAGVLAPGIGVAQSTSDEWRVGATAYGFFPSIGGSTRFPVQSGGGTIDVPVDKVVDSIKFVFMGSLDVHNGRWGAFTDLMYLNQGVDKANSRDFTIGGQQIPADTSANLGWDLKGVIWTLAGEYRVVADAGLTLDLLAGTRLADLEQELRWNITGSLGPLPPAARSGIGKAEVSDWDFLVGLKGRHRFEQAREWSLPFYLDVGAGDSDLTWQIAGGVSYAFGWGELSAMYRYLDYDMKSGRPIKDLNFSGFMVGATFRW